MKLALPSQVPKLVYPGSVIKMGQEGELFLARVHDEVESGM
jgi:hypothetical protein